MSAEQVPCGGRKGALNPRGSAYVRTVITSVGRDLGTVQHLRDALEPVQPDHDDLQRVPLAGEDAYTVVAVPDYLADAFRGDKESVTHPYKPVPETAKQKTYGNYYATLFALRTPETILQH